MKTELRRYLKMTEYLVILFAPYCTYTQCCLRSFPILLFVAGVLYLSIYTYISYVTSTGFRQSEDNYGRYFARQQQRTIN